MKKKINCYVIVDIDDLINCGDMQKRHSWVIGENDLTRPNTLPFGNSTQD